MSVNPSLFSMDFNSPSPAPEAESPEPGPSRKRPRTTSSSEDRKEARAHRNRIAAQNSRDRRKAQFSYLERRVTELEEENKLLRAGLAVPPPRADQLKAEEQEREKAKERENGELRERIKTLEKGWDAVMKALAAQGLSTATAPAPAPAPVSPSPPAADPPAAPQPPSESAPSPTFPEPTMTFPISPAPSHTSLDFDLDLSSSSSFMTSSPVLTPKTEQDLDTTRHLARVASIAGGVSPPPMALQRVVSTSVSRSPVSTTETAIDDATMEDLFREILAPSPRLTAASLPFDAAGGAHFQATPTGTAPPAPFPPQVNADGILGLEGLVGGGVGEAVDGAVDARMWGTNQELEVDMLEMDRILGLLPAAADAAFQHDLEDLGLGLEWADMENLAGSDPALVGVF
ncbi:hypothetical protein C8R43DRAFT_946996 [Mycena crocata]|nr:hypothetical protein C8R43DRAFT_946996 [Mycena crocata]